MEKYSVYQPRKDCKLDLKFKIEVILMALFDLRFCILKFSTIKPDGLICYLIS